MKVDDPLLKNVAKVGSVRGITVREPPNQEEILRIIRNDEGRGLPPDDPPLSLEDARHRIEAAIVARAGAGAFRSQTLNAYGRRCAISDCDLNDALEAAHIVPYLGAHTNVLANGILLRADLHTLFDRKRFTIDPDTLLVSIAEPLRGTSYAWLEGRAVRAPAGVPRAAFSANLRALRSDERIGHRLASHISPT